MPEERSRIIQVINVAPGATRDQMMMLFSFLGKISDLQLYPTDESIEIAKICYVKYSDPSDADVALQLSSTVFIDRALFISRYSEECIPDEASALKLLMTPGGLTAATVTRADELSRTVYVTYPDSTVNSSVFIDFFSQAGEVKYMRMAGDINSVICGAFIEFTNRSSAVAALAMSNQLLAGHVVHVQPALNPITKAPVSSVGGIVASSREVEEAMRKVNEAQSLIEAVIDPELNGGGRSRSRGSRSHSRRSPSRRSRSRNRSRSRKSSHRRSRSRSHHSRSRHSSRSHRNSSSSHHTSKSHHSGSHRDHHSRSPSHGHRRGGSTSERHRETSRRESSRGESSRVESRRDSSRRESRHDDASRHRDRRSPVEESRRHGDGDGEPSGHRSHNSGRSARRNHGERDRSAHGKRQHQDDDGVVNAQQYRHDRDGYEEKGNGRNYTEEEESVEGGGEHVEERGSDSESYTDD